MQQSTRRFVEKSKSLKLFAKTRRLIRINENIKLAKVIELDLQTSVVEVKGIETKDCFTPLPK